MKVRLRNELQVPEGHKRPARLAKLNVRVGRVELDVEIEAIKLLKLRQKSRVETIPKGMPSIALVVRWLADLGGYSGNSKAGPPGSITIGRGMVKLATAVEILEAIKSIPKKR